MLVASLIIYVLPYIESLVRRATMLLTYESLLYFRPRP